MAACLVLFPVASFFTAVFLSAVSFYRCLFLAFCVTACAAACRRQEIAATATEGAGAPAGSVWVADKEGQPGKLFFCGTIHILRQQDYPLSPGYEAAYANSTKLIFELPPGASASQRMDELGTYPPTDSLEAHVSKETWDGVKKWAAHRGKSVAALNRYRPWYLSLIITSIEYSSLGAKPGIGVDQYFEERAKKDAKPGEGLESVELQLQLFAQLSGELQQNLLEQTLAEISTLPEEYEKMINAWKNGSLEELHDMLFKEAERYPELMDLFIINRNRAWIDRLDAMLKKGDRAMVLVGTGHLGGKTGILQMLKDRGYRVRHYREVKDL